MKLFVLTCGLLCCSFVFAQDTSMAYQEPSKESQAYHEYRVYQSQPCHPAAKVKAAVKTQVKTDGDDNRVMSAAAYKKLTVQEKFVYCIIHPESYSQICDAMMPIQDEQKKIFASLPETYDDYNLSERQKLFMKTNRDTVMAMIKDCVNKNNKRIGANFKRYIVLINGREMIPWLVEIYNLKKKDHDILTVLMQLMRDNLYKPFLESAGYKKLYGEGVMYDAFLNANTANINLIIKRAMDFYNSRQGG
jgi:hypothetical protein